jgi:hypothetical protein
MVMRRAARRQVEEVRAARRAETVAEARLRADQSWGNPHLLHTAELQVRLPRIVIEVKVQPDIQDEASQHARHLPNRVRLRLEYLHPIAVPAKQQVVVMMRPSQRDNRCNQ